MLVYDVHTAFIYLFILCINYAFMRISVTDLETIIISRAQKSKYLA